MKRMLLVLMFLPCLCFADEFNRTDYPLKKEKIRLEFSIWVTSGTHKLVLYVDPQKNIQGGTTYYSLGNGKIREKWIDLGEDAGLIDGRIIIQRR